MHSNFTTFLPPCGCALVHLAFVLSWFMDRSRHMIMMSQIVSHRRFQSSRFWLQKSMVFCRHHLFTILKPTVCESPQRQKHKFSKACEIPRWCPCCSSWWKMPRLWRQRPCVLRTVRSLSGTVSGAEPWRWTAVKGGSTTKGPNKTGILYVSIRKCWRLNTVYVCRKIQR